MSKTYTLRLYQYQYISPIDNQLKKDIYTTQGLITFANTACQSKTITTIEDACYFLKTTTASVQEIILDITNDDFLDNIKPDGATTKELNLGPFEFSISNSYDLIKNFHKLLPEQQKIISAFIDKVTRLHKNIFKEDDITPFQSMMSNILSTFVSDRFADFDRPDTGAQLTAMRKVINLDDNTLYQLLEDVTGQVTLMEMQTKTPNVLSRYSDNFFHKITVTNAKNS